MKRTKTNNRTDQEKPKRGPGRPPTKQWPEPLNVGPKEVARSLFNGPPKKDSRVVRPMGGVDMPVSVTI